MAGRKSKQSGIGVKDIAAAWRAGWTPSDVNAILDRLEAIGDPLDPPDEVADDPADVPADIPADIPADVPADVPADIPADDFDDEYDDPDEDDEVDDKGDKLKESIDEGLELIKHTGLEIENARLKRELQMLQQQNRYKDVSGEAGKVTKSPEQSLIDVFQSCF